METTFLWKSFPKPYKQLIIKGFRIQKSIWKYRPIKKTTIPILRIMKEYQVIKPKVPVLYTLEKFVQHEMTGSMVQFILGDDPYIYMQCGCSVNMLALRLIFQSMFRDLYIIRFVETLVHMQQALNLFERGIHLILPFVLTLTHIIH